MAGALRVLFLLLDDALGPVMLMLTDAVHPYNIRIVGLYSQDGTTTALLKHGDTAFHWVEDVVEDLGIECLADMVTSFPMPDVNGIDSDTLTGWADDAFNAVLETGKLLIP